MKSHIELPVDRIVQVGVNVDIIEVIVTDYVAARYMRDRFTFIVRRLAPVPSHKVEVITICSVFIFI